MPLAFVSLFAVGVFGLGAWVYPARALDGRLPVGGLFVSGVLGLAACHSLVYAGAPTWTSVAVAIAGGGAGMATLAWRARASSGARLEAAPSSVLRAAGLAAVALLPGVRLLTEPLGDYDARSIWFFQGKIIFFEGGLLSNAWTKPELAFARTDYPKLIPLLAAQAGTLAGYWNDYWPKAGLLVLLALLMIGLHSLPFRTPVVWATAVLMLLLEDEAGGHLLSNGYADGYLAGFLLLATAQLGMFLIVPSRRSLWLGLASLALAAQLKNEGIVAASMLLVLFGAAALVRGQRRAVGVRLEWSMVIPFLPVFLWFVLRARLGIGNEMAGHATWATVRGRLGDPSFWDLFARHLLREAPLAVALLACLALAAFLPRDLRRGRAAGIGLALAGFTGYAALLAAAFLATPFPLEWHLQRSLARLSHSATALLWAALLLGWAGRRHEERVL